MSISKIAKHLKVSKSTVSKVINGKSEEARISKALSERILDYVEKIDYKPNALAQSLATGKSHTIGLIVENIGDSFFGPIALYIEKYLRKYNYHVLYSSTLGSSTLSNTILKMMVDKQVDGIILAPTIDQKKNIESLIINANIPLVVFDRRVEDLQTNYVGTDNYTASKEAVKHLFKKGFKSIGMITIESQQIQMLDRLKAYHEVINENNSIANTLQIPYDLDENQRLQHIAEFLKVNNFDALYFSTNYLCVSTLKYIKTVDNQVHYGMICFDDHEIFELNSPTISCIRQPIEEIAKQVVATLLQQIKSEGMLFSEVIIPSKLIVRESTK